MRRVPLPGGHGGGQRVQPRGGGQGADEVLECPGNLRAMLNELS